MWLVASLVAIIQVQTASIITDHASGQHWVQALLGLCPRVPRSPEEKVQFLRLAAFEETAVCWPEGQRRRCGSSGASQEWLASCWGSTAATWPQLEPRSLSAHEAPLHVCLA